MNIESEILSEITLHLKYCRYIPQLQRRETWNELITRNKEMHIKKFPELKDEIEENYKLVYDKKILPSMRALQFSGKTIEINNARIFNCAYLPIDDHRAFSETMFLLLSGCGVGYSVQTHHIDALPEIRKPLKKKRYLVGDSIEGWADAVRMLTKAYFGTISSLPEFDFRDIRPKGASLLTTGGRAPGPQPLKIALTHIQAIFERKENGSKLTSLECHDIICHIADAVLSGGIRRAALIALFNLDDEEMLSCKFGSWWELNPQRGRANNSAVLLRNKIDKKTFLELWKKIELSNSGEPGFMFSNDKDAGTNPCAEIYLKPFQFCNLCEINASTISSQEDFNARAKSAAFIGTLQASYTDFHYLRDIWKKTTEKDALLGVGMTGIASGQIFKFDSEEAAKYTVKENERVAKLIGINKAARTTTVKPGGTTSLVLGCASGAHAWHDKFYKRAIRLGKNEPLYIYLSIYHPELIEDDFFKPTIQAIVSIPQKAPEGAITRDESALDMLERIKILNESWIRPGYRKGTNNNNVSATISINKDKYYINPFNELSIPDSCTKEEAESSKFGMNEWKAVGEWMWNNKEYYNALSVMPADLGTYIQAPYQTISEDEFNEMVKHLHAIDLTKVVEIDDNTQLMENLACSGASCEIV